MITRWNKLGRYVGTGLILSFLIPSTSYAVDNTELQRQLQELIEQNRQLTERISEIEAKLASGEPESLPEGEGNSFLQTVTDSVELSGVVEIEMNSINDDINDEDTSDISLATVEIGIDASLSEWTSGHILLLYEEGEENNHIIVDEGTITIGNLEKSPFYLTAGKMYLPFGSFESNMISDPLTLEIGETGDSAVQIGFESGGFYGSVYTYNGDISETKDSDDKIDTFGANLGYSLVNDQMALDVGVDWMNNIGDTDALGDFLGDPALATPDEVDDYVAGLSIHAVFTTGPFTLIGEYVAALDDFEATEISFDGKGAEPEAWNLEFSYTTEMFNGRETTFAVAYQGTDEALALELPEERYLAAVSLGIFDNTSLALEWAHDEDYNTGDGGTGKDADSATMQLAVEF